MDDVPLVQKRGLVPFFKGGHWMCFILNPTDIITSELNEWAYSQKGPISPAIDLHTSVAPVWRPSVIYDTPNIAELVLISSWLSSLLRLDHATRGCSDAAVLNSPSPTRIDIKARSSRRLADCKRQIIYRFVQISCYLTFDFETHNIVVPLSPLRDSISYLAVQFHRCGSTSVLLEVFLQPLEFII
ncbi:hypothetical protein PanWU01x14_048010 [Parasponia andersonii]|uniref:Uncharacterized protein n=1 Tax=Parasponia andersonii TaxID=3476 RepID=A0A2P5DN81_PARAD|nr:hypothetical protein PanWU01x14_048010 [Parasponia andersonii]